MVELTMRLLVSPVVIFAALLLPTTTTQALDGFPSLTSFRGLGNGRQPLSREEELMKALNFLEEYERNLEDDWVEEDTYEDLQPETFQMMRRGGVDEDIVPEDFWEDDQDDIIQEENTGKFRQFLQNLLQGANRNRNAAVSKGYIDPQRSTINNQYVLFSPVDADLEDEIALEKAIEKLKVKEKEEKLWEDIIGDMLVEEILETDAREDIKELIDVEQEEEELFDEDSIFEGEDPWSEIEPSEVIEDESDVVPWSWAGPEWDEGEVSSSLEAEFDIPDSLTSEDEDEIEREAAVILLEEILEDEEEEERKEQEQEDILEMIMGDDSQVDEEDLGDAMYESSVNEEAIENYFKALLDNSDESEEILEEVSNELEDSEEGSEENWGEDYSSSPEDLAEIEGEIIQDYGLQDETDDEDEEETNYDMLLREITNEIEAAAEEVEEEVVAALKDQLQENNIGYQMELEEDEDEDENNSSNEIDEYDANQILSLAGILENYQLPVQEEKRTDSSTCPIMNLVNDCAFIDNFPGVDDSGRYRNKFSRACNRHQLCYTCGQSYDIESKLCNEVFDAEMLADCGQDQECIATADQFLFIASNTYSRESEPPSECHAKCLLQFLIRE